VLPGLLLTTLVAGALLVHRADRTRHQQEIAKLRSRASAAWQQALKQEQRLNRLRRRVVIPARRPGPAPAPAHDAGFLRANTFPWARILVDGRDTGHRTPLAPGQRLALSPGPHRVTFEVQGQRFSFPVKIVTGTTTRLVHRLPVEPIRY
jgi:hypothetical protein